MRNPNCDWVIETPLNNTKLPSNRKFAEKFWSTVKVFVAIILCAPFKFTAVPLTLLTGIEPTGKTSVPVKVVVEPANDILVVLVCNAVTCVCISDEIVEIYCNFWRVLFGIDNVFVFSTKAPSSLISDVNICDTEYVFDPLTF